MQVPTLGRLESRAAGNAMDRRRRRRGPSLIFPFLLLRFLSGTRPARDLRDGRWRWGGADRDIGIYHVYTNPRRTHARTRVATRAYRVYRV